MSFWSYIRAIGAGVLLVMAPSVLTGCTTTKGRAKPIKCRTFISVPPPNPDPVGSRFISSMVIKSLRKRMRKCDKFLDPKETERLWSLMNVSNEELFKLSDMGEQQSARIKERSDATHAMQIEYQVRNDKLYYRPIFYRLDPLQRERMRTASRRGSVKLPRKHPLKQDSERQLLLLGLELIPNSFQVGFSSFTYSNQRVDDGDVEEIEVRSKSIFPPIVSSINFSNVDHPYGFNTWDFSARWFGSITTTYVDNEYVLLDRNFRNAVDNPDAPDEDFYESYAIRFGAFSPEINGELSIHTILGASYVSIGIGLGFYWFQDTFESGYGLITTLPIRVGQRSFFSDRIFLDFYVAATSLATDKPNNALFQPGSTSGFFFGLGYYFPETKSYLRDAL